MPLPPSTSGAGALLSPVKIRPFGRDMSVLHEVEEALRANPGTAWQRALALSLAAEMDEKPNASIAKEIAGLMAALGAAAAEKKGDVSDDLAARRAERRKAASS